jgi:hypothetical protein
MTTIAQFLSDPRFLGGDFAGPSWDNWRVTLKGVFAEPMSDAERASFRELADREPPEKRVREAWFAIGRRGGKDSIASGVATYMAVFNNFQRHLRRGERALVLCLACDRTQAGIVFGYIASYFREIPALQPLVSRITDDTVELTNGVDITVATNSFRSIRGRTVALAILDECSYWRDENSANPAGEVYAALIPALATLRSSGAMIVGISTTYRRAGLLYEKWYAHHGRDDDNVLVIRQPSRIYNPTLDEPELAAEIAADIERDPERGGAEWRSAWRSDISDLFDRELVEAAVDPGVLVRPPRARFAYRAGVDASGGRGDAFTAAIAHDEDELAVVDCLFERRAPFDPVEVVAELAELLRSYGVNEVVGDKYAANWCSLAFEKAGISYVDSERDRSKVYLDALPVFASGRARLLDSKRLVAQLCGLERRATRTGRDLVDHPASGSDDLANSCCIALTLITARPVPAFWRLDNFPIARV